MTIPRIRGAGFGANTKLLSTEMTTVDVSLNTRCLDKGAGQTDTLSSDVTVAAGASLNFNASADILGTPTVRSGATLTFDSGSGVAGVTEATLTLSAGSTLENAGETITSGQYTQASKHVKSGSGATTAWRRTTGTDASIEIDESFDEWAVPALTSARTWTLDTTSAPSAAGIRVRVVRWALAGIDANALTIQTETGPSTLASLPASQKSWIEFVWTGTAWVVSAWGGGTSV